MDKYVSESIMTIDNNKKENNVVFHKSIKYYVDEKYTISQCMQKHLEEIYNKNTHIDIYNKFKISFSFKNNTQALDIPNKESKDIIKILDSIELENSGKSEYIVFFYILNNGNALKYKAIYSSYNGDEKDNISFFQESLTNKKKYDLVFNLSGNFKYNNIDQLIHKIRNFAKFIQN